MDEVLEQYFADKYPFMRRPAFIFDENGGIHEMDGYFPIHMACGDGWFILLNDLCAELDKLCRSQESCAEVIITDIKEKWGTLQFDCSIQGNRETLEKMERPS